MISYSMLTDEPAVQKIPVIIDSKPTKTKGFSIHKIKTDCDLIILGFVLATMLLLLDLMVPPRE